jgi:hypothetical protein
MLVFEFQADVGLNLGRFTDWLIDDKFLSALVEKNRMLLEAEGLADQDQIEQLLKTATNYGFTSSEVNSWRLMPAVFRYLDRFEELAHTRESLSGLPGLSEKEELE